jgi:ABC-2 type transport system ATP-binding protein
MAIIKIDKLTKDYGDRRGCFNVSFEIEKGEVFGYLGPNGAGKTTTIRHLLGFLKPDSGVCYIDSKSTWKNAHIINENVGYLPGEINFPERMTGMELIKWMAEMRGTKSLDKAKYLLDLFELNANSDVKRMSKGMKQKIGIVCAFMHDSKILILDEPTSGLDPLMQDNFVKLVEQEKRDGKTILMSSHMFAEVEKTYDRVAIIKNGEIVTQVKMNDINRARSKIYKLKFAGEGESKRIIKEHTELDFAEINHEKNRVKVRIDDKDINSFVALLANYKLNYVSEIKLTLEDYFMQFYSNKNNEKGEMKNVI